MMNHDEYIELKNQLSVEFDGRYVKLDNCSRHIREEDEKIDKLTLEFAKSNTKLNIMIGIMSAIAVSLLSVCVKMLFGA